MQSVDYGTIKHAALRSLLRDNLCGKEKSPQRAAATDLVFEMAPAHRQWDELVTSWDGELLQSWGWGEFKSRTGWTASRMLCLRDGKPVAAAQWLRRPVPLLGSLAYVPRGPVIAPGESGVARAVVRQVAAEARRARAFVLWVEPPWEEDDGPVLPGNFVTAPNYIQPPATGIIDLRPPCDTVFAGFQSSMRRNVRLADRRGLEVREGSTELRLARVLLALDGDSGA